MQATPRFWLSREEVRSLDRLAIEEFGVPGIVLMENAGRGCAELLMQINPQRLPVTILTGPGNNGGDGYVMARHLDYAGWPVTVWPISPSENLPADAAINRQIAQHCGWISTPTDSFPRPGWVVDALFGTGLTRPLSDEAADWVERMNRSGCPILAIDLPSGLDADTGEPLGVAVQATHTASFVAWKKGFLNPHAATWTGTVHVINIGAPRQLIERFQQLRQPDE